MDGRLLRQLFVVTYHHSTIAETKSRNVYHNIQRQVEHIKGTIKKHGYCCYPQHIVIAMLTLVGTKKYSHSKI